MAIFVASVISGLALPCVVGGCGEVALSGIGVAVAAGSSGIWFGMELSSSRNRRGGDGGGMLGAGVGCCAGVWNG